MLAIRLPPEIEKRLKTLADKTGRTKSYYVREAIVEHIDELEDVYIALQRASNPGPVMTQEDVEREIERAHRATKRPRRR